MKIICEGPPGGTVLVLSSESKARFPDGSLSFILLPDGFPKHPSSDMVRGWVSALAGSARERESVMVVRQDRSQIHYLEVL